MEPQIIKFGVVIKKYQVKRGKYSFGMSSTQCVKNYIKTVEGLLKDVGRQLIKVKSAGKQPFPN